MPQVAVACVAENRPDWYRSVGKLLVTMRNFGHQLSGAPFTAYFVEGVDAAEARPLTELGATLRACDRYDRTFPTTNKLRMFEHFAAEPNGDSLLALDCDTVVVGDFLANVVPGQLMARPAALSPMKNPQWYGLIESLGLQPAASPTVMLGTRQQVPAPYLNSGVVLVPGEYAAALAQTWVRYVDEFIRQSSAGVEEPWTGYFLDQIAFTCALLELELPVELLSAHVNLPTAVPLKRRLAAAADIPISLLHYHKHIDEAGLLLATDAPVVNRLIDRVNAVISARMLPEADAAQPSA